MKTRAPARVFRGLVVFHLFLAFSCPPISGEEEEEEEEEKERMEEGKERGKGLDWLGKGHCSSSVSSCCSYSSTSSPREVNRRKRQRRKGRRKGKKRKRKVRLPPSPNGYKNSLFMLHSILKTTTIQTLTELESKGHGLRFVALYMMIVIAILSTFFCLKEERNRTEKKKEEKEEKKTTKKETLNRKP